MCVEAHIKAENSEVRCELWLTKDGELIGRADVMEGNYVWEIKHATRAEMRALRILMASKQANDYIGATAVRTNTEVKDLGPAGRFEGEFTITVMGEIYLVRYDTPQYGAIIYSVVPTGTLAKVNYPLEYRERSTSTAKAMNVVYGILGGGLGLAGSWLLNQEIFDGGKPMLNPSPG